jgi:hypothetical protein
MSEFGDPPNEEIEDVVAIANTDKAVLVRIEGADYWIPFSQIGEDSTVWEKGDSGTLVIPAWLAKSKGII